MRCRHCGEEVRAGMTYCGSCGRILAHDEEQTRVAQGASAVAPPAPAVDSAATERIVFKSRPTLLFIAVGYAVAAMLSLLAMIIFARLGVSAFASLLGSLVFLLFPAYYHVRRNAQRYTLTDSRMEIDRGVLMRQTRNLPLHTIQDVTVSASMFKRLLGIGDLIIENASEWGGAIVLRNIHRPRRHADLLLRELRRWRER